MPVLEAPPPPAVITSPVLESTLMEYKGKGALYTSGTLFLPMLSVEVSLTSSIKLLYSTPPVENWEFISDIDLLGAQRGDFSPQTAFYIL